jgi:hypothetical protein
LRVPNARGIATDRRNSMAAIRASAGTGIFLPVPHPSSKKPADTASAPELCSLGAFSFGGGKDPMIEANKLEYWASLGRLERVAEALQTEPDVNIRGVGGYTAMHAAAENGHLAVIQLLADYGAALNVKVESGETPLALAMVAGQHEAGKLLRSLGAS